MGRFENKWINKVAGSKLNDKQKFIAARIEEARKAKNIPHNPIAALSEEDYKKLLWAAPKMPDKFEIDVLTNSKNSEDKKLIIAYSNLVLFNSDKEKNGSQEVFKENANRIFDKAFYADINKWTKKPSKFFVEADSFKTDLFADIKNAGTEYATTLSNNNFARYGFSSNNYRAMQDVIKAFNNNYKNSNADILSNPESLKEMKKELNIVVNTIKNYVDGKGGFEKRGETEYEDRRIQAAVTGHNAFLKLYAAVSATELSISRKGINAEIDKLLYDRDEKLSENLPAELKPFYDDNYDNDTELSKIYDGYEHKLTNQQIDNLVKRFDGMCEFQFRRQLFMDNKYRDLATKLSSDQIMNHIRTTENYKKLLGDKAKISANTAGQILFNQEELNVLGNIKEFAERQLQKVEVSRKEEEPKPLVVEKIKPVIDRGNIARVKETTWYIEKLSKAEKAVVEAKQNIINLDEKILKDRNKAVNALNLYIENVTKRDILRKFGESDFCLEAINTYDNKQHKIADILETQRHNELYINTLAHVAFSAGEKLNPEVVLKEYEKEKDNIKLPEKMEEVYVEKAGAEAEHLKDSLVFKQKFDVIKAELKSDILPIKSCDVADYKRMSQKEYDEYYNNGGDYRNYNEFEQDYIANIVNYISNRSVYEEILGMENDILNVENFDRLDWMIEKRNIIRNKLYSSDEFKNWVKEIIQKEDVDLFKDGVLVADNMDNLYRKYQEMSLAKNINIEKNAEYSRYENRLDKMLSVTKSQATEVKNGIDENVLARYIAICAVKQYLMNAANEKISEDTMAKAAKLMSEKNVEAEAKSIMESDVFKKVLNGYDLNLGFAQQLKTMNDAYIKEYSSNKVNRVDEKVGRVRILESDEDLKVLANLDDEKLQEKIFDKYERMKEKLPDELKNLYSSTIEEEDAIRYVFETYLYWDTLDDISLPESKSSVAEGFAQMAAFQLRRQLYKFDEYRELSCKIDNKDIVEYIKSTEDYKKTFGNPDNITKDVIKNIFLKEEDCKMFGNYIEFANNQLQKIVKPHENAGI